MMPARARAAGIGWWWPPAWPRLLRDWGAQFQRGGEPAATPPLLRPLAVALFPAWRALREEAAAHAAEAARMRQILQDVDTAVVALDAERRLLYCNPRARALFRMPAAAAGERPPALARLAELAPWVEAAGAGGEPRSGRLQLPDQRTLQLEVAPLEAGARRGVVILARDVSEMAHLETLRRDFVAAVSHELRTPVTSIRGYAEMLLEEDSEPEARRQFLDTILHNAQRLEKLAGDLITLSSIETGHYPFHFRHLDAAALLAPAVAVLRPQAERQRCALRAEASPPGWVRADGEALHRVLLNLIDNALTHTGPGTHINVRGAPAAGEYRIEVRDDGPGISSDDQPRVFERFYRADKSHARSGGGSGLGLALVKHIVQEHGGRVELESRLGAGSTFRVCLPLADGAAPSGGPLASPGVRRGGEFPAGSAADSPSGSDEKPLA